VVRVTPRGFGAAFVVQILSQSDQNELVGVREGELCVRLKALPTGAAADENLTKYLASLLDVSKGDIQIVAGHGSEQKIVAVTGLPPQEVTDRLLAQFD